MPIIRQLTFSLAILLFLIGCHGHRGSGANTDSLATQPAAVGLADSADRSGVLTISPALLVKFQEECRRDTFSYDKKFASNFIELIRRFSGRKLDTTILTLGNISGDAQPDSISTRVYLEAGDVHVDSKWLKNNRVMWRDTITGPYTELQANLVDSTRSSWVFFGIGVFYGPPNFYSRKSAVDSGAISLVYTEGVDDLKKLGIRIDTAEYKAYLREFNGDVLTCGQPESRERLWIWYKPAGRMITYYQP